MNVYAQIENKFDNVKDGLYKEFECLLNKSSKYNKEIVLGDFTVKVGMEDIFKATIWY
jgi:hypothetical protein